MNQIPLESQYDSLWEVGFENGMTVYVTVHNRQFVKYRLFSNMVYGPYSLSEASGDNTSYRAEKAPKVA